MLSDGKITDFFLYGRRLLQIFHPHIALSIMCGGGQVYFFEHTLRDGVHLASTKKISICV